MEAKHVLLVPLAQVNFLPGQDVVFLFWMIVTLNPVPKHRTNNLDLMQRHLRNSCLLMSINSNAPELSSPALPVPQTPMKTGALLSQIGSVKEWGVRQKGVTTVPSEIVG